MRHDLHQPMAMFTLPGALTQNLLSAHYRLCLGVCRRPSMWLMLRQPNHTIPQHTSPGWSATLCVAPYGHPEGSTWPKVNLTPSQSFPISVNNTIYHPQHFPISQLKTAQVTLVSFLSLKATTSWLPNPGGLQNNRGRITWFQGSSGSYTWQPYEECKEMWLDNKIR